MKMKHIMLDGLYKVFSAYSTSALKNTYESMEDIWTRNSKNSYGWKKPDDYHVTVYYVGRDEERTEKQIY